MKRLGDFFVLLFSILLVWQCLHWIAGDIALTSPAVTLRHLATMMLTADFWLDVAETGRAFGLGVLISLIGGIGIGVLLGIKRTAGTVSEPILIALYSLPK